MPNWVCGQSSDNTLHTYNAPLHKCMFQLMTLCSTHDTCAITALCNRCVGWYTTFFNFFHNCFPNDLSSKFWLFNLKRILIFFSHLCRKLSIVLVYNNIAVIAGIQTIFFVHIQANNVFSNCLLIAIVIAQAKRELFECLP